MAPGVSERVQLRFANARMVSYRDFDGAKLGASRLHHYLRRELHPFALQRHLVESCSCERAEAAVSVADLKPEEDIEYLRQDRVADAAVTPAHGLRPDLAGEAGTEHVVVAVRYGLDELGNHGE